MKFLVFTDYSIKGLWLGFTFLITWRYKNFFLIHPQLLSVIYKARVHNHLSSKQNRSQIISVEVTFWKKEIVKSTVHKTHLLRALLFTKPCCRLQLHWKWTFWGYIFLGFIYSFQWNHLLNSFLQNNFYFGYLCRCFYFVKVYETFM